MMQSVLPITREMASSSNRILAALPDDAFRQLQPDLRNVTLPQGTVCYDVGASVDQVYFPES